MCFSSRAVSHWYKSFCFCRWRPGNRWWLFCLQMGVLVQAAFCQPWRSDRVLQGRTVWEVLLLQGTGFKTSGSPSDSGQKASFQTE